MPKNPTLGIPTVDNQRQRENLERSQREMEIYQNRGTMIRIILDFFFSEIMQARKA